MTKKCTSLALHAVLLAAAPATAFVSPRHASTTTALKAGPDELFQRSLLEARFQYEGKAAPAGASSTDKESFQRSLLAEQLKQGKIAAAKEAEAAAAKEAELEAAKKAVEELMAIEAAAAAKKKAEEEAAKKAEEEAAAKKAEEEAAAAAKKAEEERLAAEAAAAKKKAEEEAAAKKKAEEEAAAAAKAEEERLAAEAAVAAKAEEERIAAEKKAAEEAAWKAEQEKKLAEARAAAATQKQAEEAAAAKARADELAQVRIAQEEELDALQSKTSDLKDRAKSLVDKFRLDQILSVEKLLPAAQETISGASSALVKFGQDPQSAANKLKERSESSPELVKAVASGAANTLVDGVGAGFELIDSIRSDDELTSVVGDALDTAGSAVSALVAPDPFFVLDGDDVQTNQDLKPAIARKAKIAYICVESFSVAVYASFCGFVGYSQAGTPVAQAAGKAKDGFFSAVAAVAALGVRSFDVASDSVQKTVAEGQDVADQVEEQAAAEKKAAEEAKKKEEEEAAAAKEAEAIAAAAEEKAKAEAEAAQEKEESKKEEPPAKKSPEEAQRALLAARLEMEKRAS